MARSFDKNQVNELSLGVGALGPRLNGLAKISILVRLYFLGLTAGAGLTSDRAIQIHIDGVSTTGVAFGVTGATPKFRVGARSVNTDAFQTSDGNTTIVTGQWYNLGAIVNYTAKTIQPVLDAVFDNTPPTATFANATYTQGTPSGQADFIGAADDNTTGRQVHGYIQEAAIWSDDIGLAGFQQLQQQFSPLMVLPGKLIFYMEVTGRQSPEIDHLSTRTGVVNGSLPFAEGPRIIYPTPVLSRRRTTGVTGGIKLTQLEHMPRGLHRGIAG